MFKTALLAAAVMAIAAAPALAKAKKEAAPEAPSAPIPYDQLAAVDAKMNGPAPKAHMPKKKPAEAAAAPAAQ